MLARRTLRQEETPGLVFDQGTDHSQRWYCIHGFHSTRVRGTDKARSLLIAK
jgi:hypothetical protein